VSAITEFLERSDFSSPMKEQRVQVLNNPRTIPSNLKHTQKTLIRSILTTPLTNNPERIEATSQSTDNGIHNVRVTRQELLELAAAKIASES